MQTPWDVLRLEVGQGVATSADGTLDSQTMTSAHRQTRAPSPALSRQQMLYFIYLLLLSVETVTIPRAAARSIFS